MLLHGAYLFTEDILTIFTTVQYLPQIYVLNHSCLQIEDRLLM